MKNRLFKTPDLRTLAILIQLIFSTLYSLTISQFQGTDFGGYFTISQSISKKSGLYSTFFDHKGPLYYGFLNILGSGLPFDINSARILLFCTAGLWFLINQIVISGLVKKPSHRNFLNVLSSAVFVGMTSNGSIVIFESTLILYGIYQLYKYIDKSDYFNLVLSSLITSAIILTRIDGIALMISMAIIVFLFKRKIGAILIYISITLFSFLLQLVLFMSLFHFSMQDYIFSNFKFNLFYSKQSSQFSHLFFKPITFSILISSSILVFLILALSNIKNHTKHSKMIAWLCLSSLFMFLSVNLDKDYEVFIVYPFLLFAIYLVLGSNHKFQIRKSWYGVLALPLILIFMQFGTTDKCLFIALPSCSQTNYLNQIRDVEMEYDLTSTDYIFNQGWPYLKTGKKPVVNFTPYYLLKMKNGPRRMSEIELILKNQSDGIWLDKDSRALIGTNELFGKLTRRTIARESVGNLELWIKSDILN